MEIERESFVVYRSFYEAIEILESDEEKGKLYSALFNFGLNGKEPELTGVAKAIFEEMRGSLNE